MRVQASCYITLFFVLSSLGCIAKALPAESVDNKERVPLRMRFREWRRRAFGENDIPDNVNERIEDFDEMTASVQSIDSTFISESRDTINDARDIISSVLRSHVTTDVQSEQISRKYSFAFSQIPVDDVSFAMYLKDAMIGYDANDLAAPYFAFRIKGRRDLIAVLDPHLADKIKKSVNEDIDRIWPLLAA